VAKKASATSPTRAVIKPITISGGPGDDAKQYQIKAVRSAIEEWQQ
jgi:hypothetical protein